MKILPILCATILVSCAITQNTSESINLIAKASCGTCNFDMTNDECELAVEIDKKHYFVEGSSVDGHGDAHSATGLCSTIRDAKIIGKVRHGVFVAESFQLIPIN
ncbi:MAG: DUF6370 family protein [Crocinitomicaceae bacterium]|nr:DUF6370 family protein [Crocinitomicaceae bacterium]